MGCIFSKVKERELQPSDAPKTRDCIEDTEILSITEVSDPCVAAKNSLFQNQSNTPSRTESVERVMESVMESRYDFDLIYITERIISVFFMSDLDEHRYRSNLKEVAAMLRSKHQERFLVINLSEKRHDICRLNPKVEEFGWPDQHAPPLNSICTLCKTMETWLNSDPRNVVVLHCKGNRGKTGVIIAAYMHYSKTTAREDQALTNVAMRKFCEDKISSSLQPSQNRYIYYFAGLLSGAIKINSSPLFLHQVHIPVLDNYQPGYAPFLKIYQSLKLVYTSRVYDNEGSTNKMLCIKIEPALLLKGDIMVKCYHRRSGVCERECIFRVQFHTCTVHGAQLWFGKGELDHACKDKRYPVDATVELVFSPGPDPDKGREIQNKDPGASMDLSCTDPIVRWDSYENFNVHHQDSTEDICHTRGPLDGSLYAQVRKRRVPGFSSKSSPPVIASNQSTCPSSVLEHSFTISELLHEPPMPLPHYQPQRLDRENNGESVKKKDRETAILDDRECSHLEIERSCCGRPYSHPQSYCGPELSNAHPQKVYSKHHTLPCTHTSSLPLCEMCISHPELLWERGHSQHQVYPQTTRPVYPYPSLETHTHSQLTRAHSSHARTLPAQSHLLFSGDPYPMFHCSSHSHNHQSHQSLPSSPYHELRFCTTSPTSCSCKDCSHLREDLARSLRVSQLESPPWSRGTGFGYRQEGSVQWTRDRAPELQRPEYWGQRSMIPPILSSYGHRHCHSILKQDHPVYVPDRSDTATSSHPSPHSSGYHSPSLSCPCSPPQERESPGYASMNHSPNSSHHTLTPSPKIPSLSQQQVNNAVSSGREDSLHVNHIESNNNQTKDTYDDLAREARALSLQVQTSTGPSLEPGDSDQSHDVKEKSNPLSRASIISSKLTQEPLQSETKDAIVTESTSTTTLSSEPSQSSEPGNSTVSTSISHQEMEENKNVYPSLCSVLSISLSSPHPSICPSERSSISELPLLVHRMTPLTDGISSNEEGSTSDLRSSSPVPDGCITPLFPLASTNYPLLTVPHVPYTGYTTITIPASPPQPPLPEKQHTSPLQDSIFNTSSVKTSSGLSNSSLLVQVPSLSNAETRRKAAQEPENRVSAKFVQDSSKFWYKPGISRDQAIAVLKDKESGYFLIRDSNSFQGAYGLALKVATLPPHAISFNQTSHSEEQLVRHFLIESGAKGVKIKGCQNETYFGSLSALVYQHSITPVSLPCKLRIPDKDLVGELQELHSGIKTSTAAELLKQGAACNVLYINSVDTESLTGPQAISKAIKCTLTQDPLPSATVVHFKVSAQGITLTDNQRRLFFRRHYPIHNVIFSCVDPEDQRWTVADNTSKMFGFVARRSGSGLGNVCHLFAELEPEQPATAIVNFINKVMLARNHLRK
ncbi:tensin-2 [Trichomycterus rosablanca]|uniref:tensin-2 n=1 Tax=Trichomycterus rosablanca TaxID=2290929 RepID=UPI002F3593C1